MATCYDCIHCDACSDAGDSGFSCLKEKVSKCKHFKNKADVEEVKHGYWIEIQEMFYDGEFQSEYPRTCYKCSECGLINMNKYPYCNCGAKMDGGKANDL